MPPSLHHQLERHAAARPDALALVEWPTQRSITWAGLCSAIDLLARQFIATLPPNATVLLIAGNRIEYVIAFHAGLLAGATVFPLSPQLSPAEWREAARRSGAIACIAGAPALDALAGHVPTRLLIDAVSLAGFENPHGLDTAGRAPGSLLLQSSGTTGLPKIVRRSLTALEAVGHNCIRAVGMREDDRMLAVIPVCHSYGIDHAVMAAALSGCTVELHARFDAAAASEAIVSGRTTLLPAVPFIFESLTLSKQARAKAVNLRRAISAGSTLPPRVFDAFHNSFNVPIGQLYGSTEFGSVTFNDPSITPFDPLSVGRAMPGVAIRILDRDKPDIDAPLPLGEEGQIAIAAPSMLSEYLGLTESPSFSGFFLSGDLGVLDAHRRLTITGRVKLLIDVGGHKVNPLEVESILNEHPAVRESIVIPTPVSDTINRLKAVIVWKAARDVESLHQFARQRLAPFKVPRVFEDRSSLPRTPGGKLLRSAVT